MSMYIKIVKNATVKHQHI